MAKINPQQMADKYKRRVAGAGADYSAGVQDPKRSWLDGYTSSVDRMEHEMAVAFQEKRHVKGAQKAGDGKWQRRAMDVGANHYQESAPYAAQAYAEKASDIAAAAEAARMAAESLPNANMQQRLQRAVTAMTATHEYWKNRSKA